MMDMDIIIYQPFVNEIKELIQRKQFQAIKIVNTSLQLLKFPKTR